ncbi:hypothetical protein KBA63_02480 [Candidatus Woesebacteria bacterium]|nr:hypothetical protein [Candidatus Woesebacteria bacterium]
MSVLDQYLKKINVESYSELSDEEKRTFRSWEDALKGRKLTDDDVRTFLESEKEDAIDKLSGVPLNEREDIFLKMKLDFIRKTIKFLMMPEIEKKLAEGAIQRMID